MGTPIKSVYKALDFRLRHQILRFDMKWLYIQPLLRHQQREVTSGSSIRNFTLIWLGAKKSFRHPLCAWRSTSLFKSGLMKDIENTRLQKAPFLKRGIQKTFQFFLEGKVCEEGRELAHAIMLSYLLFNSPVVAASFTCFPTVQRRKVRMLD